MRFYAICPRRNLRIYLTFAVERRSQIDAAFTVKCPFDQEIHTFRREDVIAAPSLGASIGGAVLGGIIGAIVAGPLGAILGGGAGLLAGDTAEKEELQKVKNFNAG